MKANLTFANKLAYGLGDFAFNLSFQGAAIFLLIFYTDVLGIKAEQAGLIFLIATIWDAISDPIMGFIANRTNTPWGKYRPYLLFAAVPLGISYVALFYQPDLSYTGIVVYALLTHVLFRTCFTIGNIPYSTLATEMTYNEGERSSLAGFRIFLGMGGALVVGTLTKNLIDYFNQSNDSSAYVTVAMLSAMLAAVIFIISFYYTREQKHRPNQSKSPDFSLWKSLKMVSQNWPFLLLFGYMMLGMGCVAILTQSLNYYFTYQIKNTLAFSTAMFFLQGSMMLSIPLWVVIAQKNSKRNALLLGSFMVIIGSLAFYFEKNPSLIWINSCLIFIGAGIGCGAFSFWTMLPDTVEFGEWKSGIRAEAVIAGLGLFSLKISLGLGTYILGLLLSNIGYVPNTSQSAETLAGLHSIASITPALAFSGIATIIWFYPINAIYHKRLIAELESRKKETL